MCVVVSLGSSGARIRLQITISRKCLWGAFPAEESAVLRRGLEACRPVGLSPPAHDAVVSIASRGSLWEVCEGGSEP